MARELMSRPVPEYGSATFAQKYGTDSDQILTEIFDYIRTENLRDSTRDKGLTTHAEKDKYKFSPRGIVVPLVVKREGRETMSFGRWPAVSEVALVFYHAGYVPAAGGALYLDPAQKAKLCVSANLMRAFVVIETLNPMQGYAPSRAFNQAKAGKGKVIVHELTGLMRSKLRRPQAPRGWAFPRRRAIATAGHRRQRGKVGTSAARKASCTASGPIYIQGKDTQGRSYKTAFGSLVKLPAGKTARSFPGCARWSQRRRARRRSGGRLRHGHRQPR